MEKLTIVDVPVCDLLSDGSGAEVWLERSDGPALKLEFTKSALAFGSAKLSYASARLASQGATGQTVGLPVVVAKALAHMGSDQITIAAMLADGVGLQLQMNEGAAIQLAGEIVKAVEELQSAHGKPQ